MKTCILSVIYYERDWAQTAVSMAACRVPIFMVDRRGVGGLAAAINRGVAEIPTEFEYVWIVTNPVFGPDVLPTLIREMGRTGMAGITPAFKSDHPHICPAPEKITKEVPFIEFTAPIVNHQIFREFWLDEQMPYIGHDLDWGYRIRKAGHKVGVCHAVTLSHRYIRHSDRDDPVTMKRMKLRKQAVEPSTARLEAKWGLDWRNKLCYGGGL